MSESLDSRSLVTPPGWQGWGLGRERIFPDCRTPTCNCWVLEQSYPWSAAVDPAFICPVLLPRPGPELPFCGPPGRQAPGWLERHVGLVITERKPQECVIDLSRITLSHHVIWMHPFMWLLHLGRPRWRREARIKDSTFLRTENTCFPRKGREWPVKQDRLLDIYLKPGFTVFFSVPLDKELNLWGSAFKMGIHQGPLNTIE